jgi:hypothetical protein
MLAADRYRAQAKMVSAVCRQRRHLPGEGRPILEVPWSARFCALSVIYWFFLALFFFIFADYHSPSLETD